LTNAIELIIYRQLKNVPQFAGGPLGTWGSRRKPI